MRSPTSSACVLAMFAAIGGLLGCDDVAKAIDANNNQPGEADARAAELAAIPQRVANLAADDKQLFVVAENGDVLARPADGAAAPVKIGGFTRSDSYSKNSRTLVDGEFLYILDGKAVHRMPRSGGTAEKLADAAIAGLAQSADAVFAVSTDQKKLLRIDKKTRATTDLATGFGRILDIVGESERIDVADQEQETITAVGMSDGAKKELAKNQSRPAVIGLGPEHVYWFNGVLSDTNKALENKVMRIRKDGSAAAEAVATVSGGFRGPIAADGQFVYLGRAGYGLFRAPVSGGEAVKFLNSAVVDFVVLETRIVSLEDNGFRFSEDEKNKPNRLLSVTK